MQLGREGGGEGGEGAREERRRISVVATCSVATPLQPKGHASLSLPQEELLCELHIPSDGPAVDSRHNVPHADLHPCVLAL